MTFRHAFTSRKSNAQGGNPTGLHWGVLALCAFVFFGCLGSIFRSTGPDEPVPAANDVPQKVVLESRVQLLRETTTALKRAGVEHFAFYGTLLGIVRTGALLEHDNDVDLMVPAERYGDCIHALMDLEKAFHSVFFITGDRDKGIVQVTSDLALNARNTAGKPDDPSSVLLDIYLFERDDEDRVCDRWNRLVFPGELIFPLRDARIENADFSVPAPARLGDTVASIYGSHWYVQQKGTGSTNHCGRKKFDPDVTTECRVPGKKRQLFVRLAKGMTNQRMAIANGILLARRQNRDLVLSKAHSRTSLEAKWPNGFEVVSLRQFYDTDALVRCAFRSFGVRVKVDANGPREGSKDVVFKRDKPLRKFKPEKYHPDRDLVTENLIIYFPPENDEEIEDKHRALACLEPAPEVRRAALAAFPVPPGKDSCCLHLRSEPDMGSEGGFRMIERISHMLITAEESIGCAGNKLFIATGSRDGFVRGFQERMKNSAVEAIVRDANATRPMPIDVGALADFEACSKARWFFGAAESSFSHLVSLRTPHSLFYLVRQSDRYDWIDSTLDMFEQTFPPRSVAQLDRENDGLARPH